MNESLEQIGNSSESTWSESFTMNTNMTSLDVSKKNLRPCALDESSLNIGRINRKR